MAYRARIRHFPDWTRTVAAMKDARDARPDHCGVTVSCTACDKWRPVDLDALIKARGPDFSLTGRRYRCRLTPRCTGWNRFFFQSGVMRPLWTEEQAERWSDLDWRERQRITKARRVAASMLRGDFIRLDPAPAGVDPQSWALADDGERSRLIRKARG